MNVRRISVALVAAGTIFVSSAAAAPLVYDEAVDGDIIAYSTTFNLDFGANIISGTVSGLNTNLGFDLDLFDAILPANAILDSIQFTATPAAGGSVFIPNQFQYGIDGGPIVSTPASISIGDLDISLAVAASMIDAIGSNSIQLLTVADYQITINVSEANVVPIPAALPLFLGGLGMMGFFGRRKKRT